MTQKKTPIPGDMDYPEWHKKAYGKGFNPIMPLNGPVHSLLDSAWNKLTKKKK